MRHGKGEERKTTKEQTGTRRHRTAAGSGPRLWLYVHHTDAEREWAYDRTSSVGRLEKGLDEAKAKGWVVVDMKADWRRVFAFEKE